MKKEQKILVDRINTLCREKGLSYYALSYKATVPLTTLLNIMNGVSKNPGVFTIVKICDGLDITLTDFFGTDDFSALLREEG